MHGNGQKEYFGYKLKKYDKSTEFSRFYRYYSPGMSYFRSAVCARAYEWVRRRLSQWHKRERTNTVNTDKLALRCYLNPLLFLKLRSWHCSTLKSSLKQIVQKYKTRGNRKEEKNLFL